MKQRIGLNGLTVLVVIMCLGVTSAWGIDKLPAERAGNISPAEGQLAFIRDSSLWITSVSGTGQRLVQDCRNAVDHPSWAPGNREIIFTRKGGVNFAAPDGMGGFHTVYDLFIAYLDSAEAGNTFYYFRPTLDLGSRGAEWTPDNKLIFSKDLNANVLNAGEPNYQPIRMNPDGTEIEVIRKDYQWYTSGQYMTVPSVNKNGIWAFVAYNKMLPVGMVVLPESKMNMPMDSVVGLATKYPTATGPSWSPDGKWLAYVVNDFTTNSIRIASPDMKEHFLIFEPPVNTNIYPMAPGWSPDSKWLTFSTTDGSVWVCDITGTRTQRVTGPGRDKWPAWSK